MKTFSALVCTTAVACGQVWVQQITPGQVHILEMAVAAKGDCAISGSIAPGTNAPNFGPTNLQAGFFFANFDARGNLLHAEQTGETVLLASVGQRLIGVEGDQIFQIDRSGKRNRPTALESPEVTVVAVSGCDNHSFVIAGEFRNYLTIGKHRFTATDSDTLVPFAARLDANGKTVCFTQIPSYVNTVAGTRNGGAYVLGTAFNVQAVDGRGRLSWSASVPGDSYSYSTAIAADRSGRCIIAGQFEDRMQTEAWDLVAHSTRQAVVCTLSSTGRPLSAWTLEGWSFSWDVAVDRRGSWYVATLMAGEMTTWPFWQTDGADGFIFKNGSFDSVVPVIGPGTEYPRKMALGRDGCLFVAGIAGLGGQVGAVSLTNGGTFLAKFKVQ